MKEENTSCFALVYELFLLFQCSKLIFADLNSSDFQSSSSDQVVSQTFVFGKEPIKSSECPNPCGDHLDDNIMNPKIRKDVPKTVPDMTSLNPIEHRTTSMTQNKNEGLLPIFEKDKDAEESQPVTTKR